MAKNDGFIFCLIFHMIALFYRYKYGSVIGSKLIELSIISLIFIILKFILGCVFE